MPSKKRKGKRGRKTQEEKKQEDKKGTTVKKSFEMDKDLLKWIQSKLKEGDFEFGGFSHAINKCIYIAKTKHYEKKNEDE